MVIYCYLIAVIWTNFLKKLMEQIPGLSFKGVVYGVPHLLLYILACSLPPWETWHNSSIQDGVQDGRHL